MNNKYNSIKRLIDLWETYEDESEQQDIQDFSKWLGHKLKQNPGLNIRSLKKGNRIVKSDNDFIFKSLDDPIRFLEYVSRIARLHDFYVKKFLCELPISTRLEYLFLYGVGQKVSAKKTELIAMHLVDYTTGMDIIKRLISCGLISETPDMNDKRAKLLTLTPDGKLTLDLASKKIADEIHVFLACISMNKWKKTLPVMEEINDFHADIFQVHNDKNPAELMNLMDSLKHLYK